MDRPGLIVAELRLVVREIATMPARRDQNAAAVDQAERSWEFQFGSSSHDELLFSEDRQLADERDRDAAPYEQLVRERCRFLTGFVDELLWGLRLVVENDLSQNQQEIIRLGMLVDEAVHPQPVYRYMQLEQERSEATAPTSWEQANGSTSGRRRGLPSLPAAVPSDWPNEPWFQEIEQRLLQLGLSPVELSEGHLRASHADRSRLIETIERLLSVLSARSDEEIGGRSQETRNRQSGITHTLTAEVQAAADRLGILIDTRQRRIRRSNCNIKLRPTLFALLLHFLQHGERPTSIRWFQSHWSLFGRAGFCRPNTVYDAIGELESALGPIGSLIDNVPGEGTYYLRSDIALPPADNR